ncbi:MAG: hypothetical protein ACMUJM_20200 [bacterium]
MTSCYDTPTVAEIIAVGIAREHKSVEIYENSAYMVSGGFKELLMGLRRFERQHEQRLLRLQAVF